MSEIDRDKIREHDIETRIIRKALKSLAPTLSVRKSRGTGAGGIDIYGSGEFGHFTEEEKRALEKFGRQGVNWVPIGPDNMRYYTEKAAKILGIPLPIELQKLYKERDEYAERIRRQDEELKRKYESCEHDFVRVPAIIFPKGELYQCTKCGKEKVEING